jgi:hypothetical protein
MKVPFAQTQVGTALVRGLFAEHHVSDVSARNSPTKDEISAILAEFNKINYP